MSPSPNSILVMPADIEMMRSVLITAGFNSETIGCDEKLSRKAALLVMNHFRSGMVDPKELLAELIFYFGRQVHSRGNPPARLPRYAIQGMPVQVCCEMTVEDYIAGVNAVGATGVTSH